MKKFLALFMAFVMVFSMFSLAVSAENNGDVVFEIPADKVDMTKTKKTEDIFIRDPCILVYGNKYFMYGTGAATKAGYGCYVSEDLENWAGPVNVFEADSAENFDGIGDYWAPECYYYEGNFYIFATYKSGTTQHRGVSIMKSESPLGPFTEITDGHITPHEWDAIDGTLYIDKNGEPWMIFVHEWTSMPDGVGDMSYAKLSEDLTRFTTEPVRMFKADDPFWTNSHVTDGPCPYRTKDGSLIMLWSNNIPTAGYSVGIARSSNGEIDGEWSHDLFPLYTKGKYHALDGGHGMIFETPDGRLMLSIHSPNSSTEENMTHAIFLELEDTGSTVTIKSDAEKSDYFFYKVGLFFKYLWLSIERFFENLLGIK